jgi:hypothetical protein
MKTSTSLCLLIWCDSLNVYLSFMLMELGLSLGAVSCMATQKLPSILRNTKVHYRVHKSPPPASILSSNPYHPILSRISYEEQFRITFLNKF